MSDRLLEQATAAEVEEIDALGACDHLDGELEEADLPGVIDAVDHGGEGIAGGLDISHHAAADVLDLLMDDVFGDILAAELEAIFEEGYIGGIAGQPVAEGLGLRAETLEVELGHVFGAQDAWSFGLDLAMADADLADAVHEFGDEVELELGGAEGIDHAVGRAQDACRLQGELDVIVRWHITG
jgi:hypothetical protein